MIKRPRRLRGNIAIREMVRETSLEKRNLVYPIFVVEGNNVKEEISSLKGIFHYS
ncbi:MAG: porphobilinogen synthase, partial [Niameybacter sp.]